MMKFFITSTPGLKVIKFSFVADKEAKEARVLVTFKLFYPRLIFVIKTGAYPRGKFLKNAQMG